MHVAAEAPVKSHELTGQGSRLPTLGELESAATLIYGVMPPTPEYRWPLLEERVGSEVWVKHENHGPLGAFKLRGGLVYFDHLRRTQPKIEGIVCATRGNHGQSVAFAARRNGFRVVVVVPHGNSVEKNAAMRALGAELIEMGHDFQASLEASARIAEERRWHRMPSFHTLLVRGVGTYALELFRAAPSLDEVYVPIGLGSGICGVMAARDALGLRTKVVGVVSDRAPAYAESFESGHLVEHEVSTRIADGMACRTPNAEALPLVMKGVDRVVRVTDDEIEAAMRALFSDTHTIAEGAGAAALAALLREPTAMRPRRSGVILTGGNVDRTVYARVLANDRAS
jgi:threonine dehydratase